MNAQELINFVSDTKVPFLLNGGKLEQLAPEDIATLSLGETIWFLDPRAIDFETFGELEIVPGSILPVRCYRGGRVSDYVASFRVEA